MFKTPFHEEPEFCRAPAAASYSTLSRIFLDGPWRGTFADEAAAVEVPVPSVWTHPSPWLGEVSWAHRNEARLARWITFPPSWLGHRVRIHFAGVLARAEVSWKGKRVGAHVGGFTPFQFDLGLAEDGWLEVDVKGCAAAYDGAALRQAISYPLNCEEGPLPAGIWQPVWLERVPIVEISQLWPYWDKSAERWKLKVRHRGDPSLRSLRLCCDCGEGSESFFELSASLRSAEEVFDLGVWEAVPLWSPAQPQLVRIRWELGDGFKVCASGEFETGFRAVEIEQDRILLNHQPIRLRGFSMLRHRIVPWLWREDYLTLYFRTMKSLGFNAVRTHGAIAPEVVLHVADRVGLLVQNQSSFWSMGWSGYLAGGAELWRNTEREFRAWIERDRSHPSVVIWDVENEIYRISPEGKSLSRQLVALARSLDPFLPVVASGSSAAEYTDVYHQHCVQGLSKVIEQWVQHLPQKPFFAGEWWPDQTLWGKRTLLFSGLRAADRWPREFQSRNDVLHRIGWLYGQEILRQRLLGVTGTFPFAVSTLIFEPLFATKEKLQMHRDNRGGPTFQQAGCGNEQGIHKVRRPFVNPGWSSNAPGVRFSPAAPEVEKALAPIVAGFVEPFRQAWSNESINLHLAVVNDSESPLKGAAFLSLGTSSVFLGEVEISIGGRRVFPVKIKFPEVFTESKMVPQLRIVSPRTNKIWQLDPWLVYPRPGDPPPLAVWASGVGEGINRLLASLPLRDLTVSSEAPADGSWVWILGSGVTPSSKAVSRFLAGGGHLLCLRRTEPFPWLPDVLRWVGSQRCLPHSMEGWHFDNPDRALQGLLHVESVHSSLAGEFGIKAARLGPWRSADGRVADDLLRRATTDIDPTHCFPRIVFGGPDVEDIAMGTLQWGEGEVTFSQLFLEENVEQEPQARLLLQGWLERVHSRLQRAASSPEMEVSFCLPDLGKETWPAARALSILYWDKPIPEDDAGLMPYDDLLSGGGDLICILASSESSVRGQALSTRELVVTLADASELLSGLNFTHFQEFDPGKFLLPTFSEQWHQDVTVFRYQELSPFGGVEPQEKVGHLWISRPCIGGRLHCTALPLVRQHCNIARFFRAALLAHAGVRAKPVKDLSARVVVPIVIRHSPEIPLDGDLGKWTNEEADPNLSPWTRAEPILLRPQGKQENPGVLAYLLASDRALHLLLLHQGRSLRACRSGEAAYQAAHLQVIAFGRTLFVAPSQVHPYTVFLEGPALLQDNGISPLRFAFFRQDNLPAFPDSALLPNASGQILDGFNIWQLRLAWQGLGRQPVPGQPIPLALKFCAVAEGGPREDYAYPHNASPREAASWGRAVCEPWDCSHPGDIVS